MTDRRDHVLRARPPWYAGKITECGRLVTDDPGMDTITAEQLSWRIKREGQQRTAFTVCMTCWNTATYRQPYADMWATHPAELLARELRRPMPFDRDDPAIGVAARAQRDAELHAIALLIEAHRTEYDTHVLAARDAIAFAQRRAQKEREKRAK